MRQEREVGLRYDRSTQYPVSIVKFQTAVVVVVLLAVQVVNQKNTNIG